MNVPPARLAAGGRKGGGTGPSTVPNTAQQPSTSNGKLIHWLNEWMMEDS